MFNCGCHILNRREIPVVRGQAPGQFPYALDRIEIRTIWRQVFKSKPGLCSGPPFLVQRRMMIPRVVCYHDNSPTGTRTGFPELPHKFKTRLGIKSSGLASINKFAVTQTNCSEIADTPACRMMPQYRVRCLRWNPHPASRSMLLEVNLIHRPKINVFASCHSPKFFLPSPAPQGWRWRLRASAFAGGIPVAGTIAGIDEFPDSHSICVSQGPTGFCRPKGSRLARNGSVASATQRRHLECSAHSVYAGGQPFLLRSSRQSRHFRTDAPSRLQFEGHRRADPRLGDSSSPELPAGRREDGDHIEIHRIGGSHLAVPKLWFQHPLSLMASCLQSTMSH